MKQLYAIIFGAIVSAFIGILTTYLSGKIREQEWKKENIYKPLYNEFSSLLNSLNKTIGLPKCLSTKWSNIDSYSKLLIDKNLREKFNEYEAKIGGYNKAVDEYNRVLESSSLELENAVKRAFSEILTEDKKTILFEKHNGSSGIEIKNWVKLYIEPLMSCRNGGELHQGLIEYSEARKMGHEKYFKKWYSENPNIFESLIKERSNVRLPLEEKDSCYNSLIKKSNELLDYVTDLKTELEKRVRKLYVFSCIPNGVHFDFLFDWC